MSENSNTMPVWWAGALVLAIAAVVSIVLLSGDEDDTPEQSVGTEGVSCSEDARACPGYRSEGDEVAKRVEIYNKVTRGLEVRDDKPAYLSLEPVNECKDKGCALENTDMKTGVAVNAVCQTLAPEATTNGDNTTPADDANPELATSNLWYGIRWPDGRFGYLSEVWIHPDFRGGLDLPQC